MPIGSQKLSQYKAKKPDDTRDVLSQFAQVIDDENRKNQGEFNKLKIANSELRVSIAKLTTELTNSKKRLATLEASLERKEDKKIDKFALAPGQFSGVALDGN